MRERRIAQGEACGLLSLPDNILINIARQTHFWDGKPPKEWAKAASTCKRLWELQAMGGAVITNCQSERFLHLPNFHIMRMILAILCNARLTWQLRRSRHANLLQISVWDWPCDTSKLQELSTTLSKVSGNLPKLEWVEFNPICPEKHLPHLKDWIYGMLEAASGLEMMKVGVELLPCLPMSTRKALTALDIDAYANFPEPDASRVVMDCTHLRSLTLVCHNPGWYFAELDLRDLVHLERCTFKGLPAPSSLFLPDDRVKLELAMNLDQMAAWSKLWPQIQECVSFICVEGYRQLSGSPFCSAGDLEAWPEGIGAFHGLQYLQINCFDVWPSDEVLDLAHLAYIPHVSLRAQGGLTLKISTGGWKFLEVQSLFACDVTITDAEAFLRSTGIFYFLFPYDKRRPCDLIEQLKTAEAKTGVPLYEYRGDSCPMQPHESDPPLSLIELSNHRRRSNEHFGSGFMWAHHHGMKR